MTERERYSKKPSSGPWAAESHGPQRQWSWMSYSLAGGPGQVIPDSPCRRCEAAATHQGSLCSGVGKSPVGWELGRVQTLQPAFWFRPLSLMETKLELKNISGCSSGTGNTGFMWHFSNCVTVSASNLIYKQQSYPGQINLSVASPVSERAWEGDTKRDF